MEIRVVSSLTSRDEIRIAPVILNHLIRLLDRMPIAYSITVSASADQVFRHSRGMEPAAPARPNAPSDKQKPV
jgi:hypothetical protein